MSRTQSLSMCLSKHFFLSVCLSLSLPLLRKSRLNGSWLFIWRSFFLSLQWNCFINSYVENVTSLLCHCLQQGQGLLVLSDLMFLHSSPPTSLKVHFTSTWICVQVWKEKLLASKRKQMHICYPGAPNVSQKPSPFQVKEIRNPGWAFIIFVLIFPKVHSDFRPSSPGHWLINIYSEEK